MSKRILIWSTLLLFSSWLTAQSLVVKQSYEIAMEQGERAFYPTISKDGKLLLFTSESYLGLKLYDMKTKSCQTISTAINSGFDPVFSENNDKLFFRNTVFKDGKRYDALESYDLKNEKRDVMIEPQRNLQKPQTFHNGVIIQADNKVLKSTFGRSNATIPNYVSTQDLRIFLYTNGVKREIIPFDEDNMQYIWVSLSPDATKILFTALGKGTFVSDLQGNIIAQLGYLNAPVWFGDSFVVGMLDKDDGNRVISSKIIAKSLDSLKEFTLSSSDDIAMFPTVSYQSGRVVYNTNQGKLKLVEVELIK